MSGLVGRPGHSLVNDLYQLTMAYGYWRHGMAEREAVFLLGFRSNPMGAALRSPAVRSRSRSTSRSSASPATTSTISQACATATAVLCSPATSWRCSTASSRVATSMHRGRDGSCSPASRRCACGGPLLQAQLLETPLLNLIGFQSLVATRARRVCDAAAGDRVLEFGLRRAQGFEGGVLASRASYVGGVHATSNLLAGRLFDIPVAGTHAHSWVLAAPNEAEAFRRYADTYPASTVLLVDTWDTETGVERAAEIGAGMRRQGATLRGVRLDSGDLVELSRIARRRLDEHGLENASIVASGDLDELEIDRLKRAGARIDVWGGGHTPGDLVGRAGDALGLQALGAARARRLVAPSREAHERAIEGLASWHPPGAPPRARRTLRGGRDLRRGGGGEEVTPGGPLDPAAGVSAEELSRAETEELLVPLVQGGRRVRPTEPLDRVRDRAEREVDRLAPGLRALTPPRGAYPVLLAARLEARLRREG